MAKEGGMKKVGVIFWMVFFSPLICFGLNLEQYNRLTLGTRISDVYKELGEPYTVRDVGERAQEYEFVERLAMNNELVYENHYFITVVNGQIVNKRICRESRPAFDQIWQEDPNYPTYP